MKSGRRLFGKTLRDDEVLTRFIRYLIKRYFPTTNGMPEKGNGIVKSPLEHGDERKGPKRP
jgi:hypothetical protein